jgi:HEAT repeat protein
MNNDRSGTVDPELLVEKFSSPDGAVRQKARNTLVSLGPKAVKSLSRALHGSLKEQVRWEAAKALGAMDCAGAVLPLVRALEDVYPDAAWLAAEGLKKYKKKAWPAMLRLLIKKGEDSVLLREGIHHVLSGQKEDGLDDVLNALIRALETSTAPELSISAAYDVLKKMKMKYRQTVPLKK